MNYKNISINKLKNMSMPKLSKILSIIFPIFFFGSLCLFFYSLSRQSNSFRYGSGQRYEVNALYGKKYIAVDVLYLKDKIEFTDTTGEKITIFGPCEIKELK